MGREEGRGFGWGMHVCLWWIHFDIWQNQYNIVKLKNKIKIKKKCIFSYDLVIVRISLVYAKYHEKECFLKLGQDSNCLLFLNKFFLKIISLS